MYLFQLHSRNNLGDLCSTRAATVKANKKEGYQAPHGIAPGSGLPHKASSRDSLCFFFPCTKVGLVLALFWGLTHLPPNLVPKCDSHFCPRKIRGRTLSRTKTRREAASPGVWRLPGRRRGTASGRSRPRTPGTTTAGPTTRPSSRSVFCCCFFVSGPFFSGAPQTESHNGQDVFCCFVLMSLMWTVVLRMSLEKTQFQWTPKGDHPVSSVLMPKAANVLRVSWGALATHLSGVHSGVDSVGHIWSQAFGFSVVLPRHLV